MWEKLFRNKDEAKKEEIRYILSIDGGGMRGIVPSFILKKINEELKKMGEKRPLYSYFDLIAGTSTGALISLGLSMPLEESSLKKENEEDYKVERHYTTGRFFKKEVVETKGYIPHLADPESFVSLYRDNGNRIFKTEETKGLFKLFDKVNRLFSDKYKIEPYEEFLNEIYGNTLLKELRVPTMAVAFNTSNSTPYIFRSWDDHGYYIKEAARASSAAPTYFSPAVFIDRESNETLTLIDGGTAANNPILCAYAEAVKLYPNATEYRILSLSTLSPPYSINPDEFTTNIDWLSALLGAYGDGNMNVSEMAVEAMNNTKVVRVWDDIIKKKYPLDDTSEEAMESLLSASRKLWENKKDEILDFVKKMVKEEVHSSLTLTPIPLLGEVKELSQ